MENLLNRDKVWNRIKMYIYIIVALFILLIILLIILLTVSILTLNKINTTAVT
jgi:hypothetical protein